MQFNDQEQACVFKVASAFRILSVPLKTYEPSVKVLSV